MTVTTGNQFAGEAVTRMSNEKLSYTTIHLYRLYEWIKAKHQIILYMFSQIESASGQWQNQSAHFENNKSKKFMYFV